MPEHPHTPMKNQTFPAGRATPGTPSRRSVFPRDPKRPDRRARPSAPSVRPPQWPLPDPLFNSLRAELGL